MRINEMEMNGKMHYWYENAMISSYPKVFEPYGIDDNYSVETILRKAGVITPLNKTDTETCALVVNFETRESGEFFLERLDDWIDLRKKLFVM